MYINMICLLRDRKNDLWIKNVRYICIIGLYVHEYPLRDTQEIGNDG